MTIEPHSPTWQALEQFLASRIAALHRDNESPTLDPTATAFLRGQLAALHEVLNLPTSLKKAAIAPDPYEEVLL